MARSFLKRLALFLIAVSTLPFILFFARKESPPERIEVKSHRKQTIEDFSLKAEGGKKWELSAPRAIFETKSRVKLLNPVLKIEEPPLKIFAREALYEKEGEKLFLKEVRIEGEEMELSAPDGVYLLREELFKGERGCTFKGKATGTTVGSRCILLIGEKKIIISDGVRTLIERAKI
jgi:hypothetical protein